MSRKYEVTIRVSGSFTKTIDAEDYDDLNSQLEELSNPWNIDSFDLDDFDSAGIEYVYSGDDAAQEAHGGDYSPGERDGLFEEDAEEEESEEDEDEESEEETKSE